MASTEMLWTRYNNISGGCYGFKRVLDERGLDAGKVHFDRWNRMWAANEFPLSIREKLFKYFSEIKKALKDDNAACAYEQATALSDFVHKVSQTCRKDLKKPACYCCPRPV